MNGSMHISEQLALVATIDPANYAANTYVTDPINMEGFDRCLFVVSVGVMATNATVDFSVKDCATNNGTYAAISPAKAITQLTQAGTDGNKQVLVEIKAEEMNASAIFIEGELVTAVAASFVSVVALAGEPRYTPLTDQDLASVDEIVRGG